MPTDCTGQRLVAGDVQSEQKETAWMPYYKLKQTILTKQTMPSQYTRGKRLDRAKIMADMIKNSKMSADGADWLTLRLDPYHDFNRPIAGYPDTDSHDTVVSVLNYEMNVTKPAAAAANWDAHVFTLPFDGCGLNLGAINGGVFTEGATNYNLGLVNVATDDAGGPLFPTATPVASANFTMTHVATFAGVEAGMSRVIGLGVEVIDTTAQLSKQGALTAYRMPSVGSHESIMTYGNAAATFVTHSAFNLMMTPPSTVGEAVLYRTSVQWEAKDGAYMVVGQQGIDNPFRLSKRSNIAITPDCNMGGLDSAMVSVQTPGTALNAPPLETASIGSTNLKAVNVTQSGIFLTGLHNDATFKVRVRVFVERAPMRTETDLIPLSTPSAHYDYRALALYSMLVSELPVCVPVSFNAKGDWWRWIVDTIAKVAPIAGDILVPIFGPEAALIGNSVGQLAGSVSKIVPRKQQQPQSNNNKNRRKQNQKLITNN